MINISLEVLYDEEQKLRRGNVMPPTGIVGLVTTLFGLAGVLAGAGQGDYGPTWNLLLFPSSDCGSQVLSEARY